jgi:hypothetical protein
LSPEKLYILFIMRQPSRESASERSAILPSVSVALTIAFIASAPHLLAQQYCVSGAATSVQN